MAATFQDLVREARKEVELFLPDEVKDWLDDGEPLVFLDVREHEELAEGRIPEALHIPRAQVEARAPEALPDKAARIVVYCQMGGRSAVAALSLKRLGYANVGSLEEGFEGWQRRGYPETR